MEIKKIGKQLEIANERQLLLKVNDVEHAIMCTPSDIESLIMGFVITEGFARDVNDLKLEIDEKNLKANVKVRNETGFSKEDVKKVFAKNKYEIDELRNSLKYLEIEEYKKTRGYHVACVIGKHGLIKRAYDVGRHNAVDKVVGMCLRENIDFSKVFLLISGRISKSIAFKCVRAGIPLIVSKAAIFDSAIDLCMKTGLSAVSFATNLAVVGEALK